VSCSLFTIAVYICHFTACSAAVFFSCCFFQLLFFQLLFFSAAVFFQLQFFSAVGGARRRRRRRGGGGELLLLLLLLLPVGMFLFRFFGRAAGLAPLSTLPHPVDLALQVPDLEQGLDIEILDLHRTNMFAQVLQTFWAKKPL
jgi:hypothetical protein